MTRPPFIQTGTVSAETFTNSQSQDSNIPLLAAQEHLEDIELQDRNPDNTPSEHGDNTDPSDVIETSEDGEQQRQEEGRVQEENVPEGENLLEDENWEASGFASKSLLALWFPQILDDENKSWRIWLSKRSQALLTHSIVVAAIFLINLSLTIYGISTYAYSNGVSTIYQGSCSTAKQLDLWLHLLINVLGTGMLMASNYSMQLQAAPTRAEINRAHESDIWLDIGVPSLRNFWWIGKWRRISWLLLASSSLPIHLIYNSAVFTSLASDDYTVAVVNPYFLNNSNSHPWNLTAASHRADSDIGWEWVSTRSGQGWLIPVFTAEETILQMQQNATNATTSYSKANVTSCFATYNDYWSTLSNLVIITKNDTRPLQQQVNDTLLMFASVIPNSNDWAKNQWAIENGTQVPSLHVLAPTGPVETWYLGPQSWEVDYCLIQAPATTEERCRFEYSPPIMIVVCVLNLIKSCIMLTIWWLRKYQWVVRDDYEKSILFTLGDAIHSFLREPEIKTKDMCLATKDDFSRPRTRQSHFTKPKLTFSNEPREWQEQQRSWGAAASFVRWTSLIIICIIVITTASGLLIRAFIALKKRGISTTLSAYWQLGFGSPTPWTYIHIGLPKKDPAGLISNVLIANLPQLVLSIVYLFYNAMLSCFLVQREFSQMCEKRKPLRVSEPEGIQRSSYFISLPFRYGIPLSVSSGVMHWLASQSLFLARITAFFPDGSVDNDSSFSTCGYSPIALFITILIGTAWLIAIVTLSFRHYDAQMPLVATNSLAISAACHAHPDDVVDGYLLPLQWGVVSFTNGIGHCAFSTAHDIKKISPMHKYA